MVQTTQESSEGLTGTAVHTQWGTVLNPDHTFRLLDQRVLRMEVHRLETGKE